MFYLTLGNRRALVHHYCCALNQVWGLCSGCANVQVSACRGCIKSTKYGGQKKRKKKLLAKWPKKKKKAKANKSQNEKKKDKMGQF